MNKILDGKKVSSLIKEELKEIVKKMSLKPHLAVVMVGDNPASRIYVDGKKRDAEEIGINFTETYITNRNFSCRNYWTIYV